MLICFQKCVKGADIVVQKRIESGKYSCKICDKNLASKSSLYSHVKSIHEGIRPICNICGKNYSRNSELKIHIKSIHSNKKDI